MSSADAPNSIATQISWIISPATGPMSGDPVRVGIIGLGGRGGHLCQSLGFATHDRMILAVAGGIVAEPRTYQTLLTRFHTIWLKAAPDEHMQRVRAQGDERPMAGNPEAMTQLRSLLTSREMLYDRAQARLDTSGQTRETSLKHLLALIGERGFLD